jgi:hypothetical protein
MQPKPCHNMACGPTGSTAVRLYLLRPHEPVLTRSEATREALKFAAATTLGRVESGCVAYGTAFYDGLLTQIQNSRERFCPNGGHDGEVCLQRKICQGRLACASAGQFLRRATDFVPQLQGNRHLLVAAAAFDAMRQEFATLAALGGQPLSRQDLALDSLLRVRKLHNRAATHLDQLCAVL